MPLLDYIAKYHSGNQSEFARSQGVARQQVTRWLAMGAIVKDGVLYIPSRELK